MMQGSVQERLQISPYMAAYVVISMQIGLGALGFQRVIAKDAGYDAWISVIAAGLATNVFVWMIYKICEAVDGDVMSANVYAFGKIIGNIINNVLIFYYILFGASVLGGLIEIIHTWMFPDFSPFWFGIVFLLLGIYIVYGGFRTVAGVSFFATVIPSYLLFSFGYALMYSDFTNLLPILDHSFIEFAKSGYHMSFSYVGYEILFLFYPFIKKPEDSKKWVHIGLLATTLVYTGLAVISFAYLPAGLLDRSIWPTLEMWKIVRLPIVERFEYLGIANWTLIILPNIVLALWAASRIVKRVYHFNQKKAVIFIALLSLMIVVQVPTRPRMEFIFNLFSKCGFTFSYIYTPLLYLTLVIKKKVKAK